LCAAIPPAAKGSTTFPKPGGSFGKLKNSAESEHSNPQFHVPLSGNIDQVVYQRAGKGY
jgi:hypothetical protein